MSKPGFAALILAAGEGTRLKSAVPKVLHELAGWPLIRHVAEALKPLGPAETVVVIGPGMEAVGRAVAQGGSPAKTAVQSPPRGTGDAVRAAQAVLGPRLAKGDIADVVVLFGDAV
ncbi:MAG: NTP transferase domain-containing protein, partial [Alphaproteobacteria bacterium]|nr:NTP transferase domain-containing protein [Alphaproteobacteria bacterium]